MERTIRHEGDVWTVVNTGIRRDGKVYCHLASTTRRLTQRNGQVPAQINDWIDEAALEARS